MRRLALVCGLVLFSSLVAAEESVLRRPTLEALFDAKDLELETFDDPMWLPDGSHLIYWTSRHDETRLWRYDVRSGTRELVADWAAVLNGLAAQRPDWVEPRPGDVNTSASHRRSSPPTAPSWSASTPVISSCSTFPQVKHGS